jgi:hypothetical protein
VAFALLIGATFISVYLTAFHAPRPHNVPVAVVGSTTDTARVRARLSALQPGGFQVQVMGDAASARSAVEHADIFAAYIPAGKNPRLLYAGAHGPYVTSVVVTAFTEVSRSGGRLDAVDVAPASPRDTRGMVVFYATFGLVLAGYLFGNMTYQLAPHIAIVQRLASLAAFSALGGLTIALIVRTGFGALPAPLAGIAGVVALVAAAVGAATMLLVRRLGVIGAGVGAVVFMILGNATSGGNLPPDFLPAGLRPLSFALPVGVGVRAINGLAYFQRDGLGNGIAVLCTWILVASGLLYVLERRPGHRLAAGSGRPARAAAKAGSSLLYPNSHTGQDSNIEGRR